MKQKLLDMVKWIMSDKILNIIGCFVIMALYIYLFITDAPIEKSVPTLVLLSILYLAHTIRTLASYLWLRCSIPRMYREAQTDTQITVSRYFVRLIQFLQASDILKEMYDDGLLYNPNYAAKDGKLTVNLPDGTALIVKDRGYPVGEPGIYINLRDPADNEYCVVRVEFNTTIGLKIIAYQYGTEIEVVNFQYMPIEEE